MGYEAIGLGAGLASWVIVALAVPAGSIAARAMNGVAGAIAGGLLSVLVLDVAGPRLGPDSAGVIAAFVYLPIVLVGFVVGAVVGSLPRSQSRRMAVATSALLATACALLLAV